MPTYQYACTACGHRFEAVQSFSDSSLTDCPECAGRLRKVFSSVGIVFKGSGFYRTDSRVGRRRRLRQGGAGKEKVVGRLLDLERLRRLEELLGLRLVDEEGRLRLDVASSVDLVVDQQRRPPARPPSGLTTPRYHLPSRPVPVRVCPAAAISGRRSCPHCSPAVHRFA